MYFPHWKNVGTNICNVQEVHTMGEVAREFSKIYVAIDKHQVDHKASIIEMEGKLCNQFVSTLIDLSSNYSYIISEIVEKYTLAQELYTKPWLVQLAISMKRRVSHWVNLCEIELQGMPTTFHLNVLQLGAYNILLGMDWLYRHHTKFD